MPNEAIKFSGDYKAIKIFRWRQRRIEDWQYRTGLRTHVTQPKYNLCRLIQLIAYLLSFYVFLGLFVFSYFMLITFSIKADYPKSTGLSSIPGIYNGYEKVIRFKKNQAHAITPYISEIEQFVEKFTIKGITRFRLCNMDNYWGYNSAEPSIMLKLNYVHNFIAVTYPFADLLPAEVPDALYDYVFHLNVDDRRNMIWISCEFLDHSINAEIKYVPSPSVLAEDLFTRENLYLKTVIENNTEERIHEDPAYRRVICVKFVNLPVNSDIFVKCSAWAQNIPIRYATTIFKIHVEGMEHVPINKSCT